MGKKKNWGANEKVEEARARQNEQKQTAKMKEQKQKEDDYWQAHGEGSKSKGAMKKEEQARKAEEAARRKAENRKLAEQELENAAAKPKGKLARPAVPKVTQRQLAERREAQEAADKEAVEEHKAAQRREVSTEQYQAMVEQENMNRHDNGEMALSLDAAIKVLDGKEVDKHPERRQRAAYKAYEEREIAKLREEKPGLKLSQYKEIVFKAWQKSPDNPMVQAQLAEAQQHNK